MPCAPYRRSSPPVPVDHPAAPLILERRFADRVIDVPRLQLPPGVADGRDLRLGEHDAERRAPTLRAHVGVAPRVVASDPALVRRLVQQWHVVVGVARDEDMAVAGLAGEPVEQRHALVVELEAGVLEAEPVDVGAPAGRGEQALEALGALAPVGVREHDLDFVAPALYRAHLGVRQEREFGGERPGRVPLVARRQSPRPRTGTARSGPPPRLAHGAQITAQPRCAAPASIPNPRARASSPIVARHAADPYGACRAATLRRTSSAALTSDRRALPR